VSLLKVCCQPIKIKVQQDRFPCFGSFCYLIRGLGGLINKKRVQKTDTSSLAKRQVRDWSGLEPNTTSQTSRSSH